MTASHERAATQRSRRATVGARRAAVWVALVALASACALLRAPEVPDWNDAAIAWQSYASGLAQAHEQGKPVLLVLYTRDCEHAGPYSRIFHSPDIVAQARHFVMVRVDADLAPELDTRFMPDGGYVPRTFFLDADGVPAFAIHGADPQYRYFLNYESPRELLELMRIARAALVRKPLAGATPAQSPSLSSSSR